jgi:hypothetical protein
MIKFEKYKRFFAFGCSMTDYWWPTWADIIGRQFDEYYNFGRSGAGNTFIALQIAEANQRYKFNSDDLIIVMWTSTTREDRYVKKYWHTPGNIYTQDYYDTDYIRKYSDVRGYLIRDLGLITLTLGLLKSIGCDFHMLNMSPFVKLPSHYGDYYADNPLEDLQDVISMYQSTIDYIAPDLLSISCNGKWPQVAIAHSKTQPMDYHPTPETHLDYVTKAFPGIALSKKTLNWVNFHEGQIRYTKKIKDLDAESWKLTRKNQPTL